MAVYAIGDTHLSCGCDKPMDIFRGWSEHPEKLFESWRSLVTDADTVVIPGDISWAMTLKEALADLAALDALPGRKILLKGNHDYWWSTRKKLDALCADNGLATINFLFNDAYEADGLVICGTRGWFYEQRAQGEDRVFLRELGRLRASLCALPEAAGERVAFLHYPPIGAGLRVEPVIDILAERGVRRCYYGHLHGAAAASAFNGVYRGIRFQLVSADSLRFCPMRIG